MTSPLVRIMEERNALYADPRGPGGTLSRRQKARSAELSAEAAEWAKTLPAPTRPDPAPAPPAKAARKWSSVKDFEDAISDAADTLNEPHTAAGHIAKALDELDALDRYPRLITLDELKSLGGHTAASTPIPDGSHLWR